ncbi:LysR family transcriptional regulator [Affinibrenneria salicis]|uniref:LysR family transcriptional regulator n=1 Tax=Affinibrenneria salicis TaxID=2590031 RepID=A0A5J5FTU3_9GAMM|nr:LysR family transcriptional regulator [Affinibrenneria salicis]KAA8996669.1 LysR family transcriptional regulator [Affinibrenneria salicis]
MDFKRLKYFCKVVEQGSISQAARALNIAQPPLSKRIQELEEELDIPLFIRAGRKVEPNEAGYYLYRKACEILRQVDDTARETIQISNRENRVLRIGLTHLFQSYFKPLFLELYRRHPDLKLNISVSDSGNLESLLNEGLLDVALMQKPARPEAFDCIVFNPVPLVAVVNKHLLSEKPQGALSCFDLGRFPLLLLHRSKDPGTYEILMEHFRKSGVHPNVIMRIAQPTVILDWLESGLEAAALLPGSEVDGENLKNCYVAQIFPSPLVFFPALVKMSVTFSMPELTDIIKAGYPLPAAK